MTGPYPAGPPTSPRGDLGRWRWLLSAYLVVACSYGGWRGPDLWSGWGVWAVAGAPALWGALLALRTGLGMPLILWLAMPVATAIGVGGPGLLMAWMCAEETERWADPATRAAVGMGLGLAAAGLMEVAYRSQRKTSGGDHPPTEDVPDTPRPE